MNKTLFALMILWATISFATEFSVKSGEVKFTAIGKPGFLKIRGSSHASYPSGKIKVEKNSVRGELSFELKSLDTGIDLRNEHMKEKYLEIKTYPNAKLVLDPIAVASSDLKDMKEKFTGELSLHGVTKKVSGNYNFSAEGKKIAANFEIKVSDFKIDIPKYLGVTVSETVQIEIDLTLK